MLKAIHFDRENLGQLFTKKFFIVIIISIPSAIVADFFNIPLAWMIGPMIATSLIALNGFEVLMPKIALSSILIILGLILEITLTKIFLVKWLIGFGRQ